eukprot:GHUV01024001.1.p1 GENE.GHUV01024001.1~~GHUV01024001.1.p1  ORF type:complete len:153 (+),score=1.76 GHUV01024001.1:434-892(+)
MDIVHPWTLDESGHSLLPITTFSIAMIHRQSGGKLPLFIEGIKALEQGLSAGDRVLIAEACNHNRITDNCNDIGMVQIPQKLEKLCGKGLKLEHAFGRCAALCYRVQSRGQPRIGGVNVVRGCGGVFVFRYSVVAVCEKDMHIAYPISCPLD